MLLWLDIRGVLVRAQRRLRSYAHYRAATHNLYHCYPAAEAEDLEAAGHKCPICRDRMTVRGGADNVRQWCWGPATDC
jgi:hypothetical protein